MRVTLMFFEGCPGWRTADEHLRPLAAELGFELVHYRVDTDEEAARVGFPGSPSILVDGDDLFPEGHYGRDGDPPEAPATPAGLSCRLYDTPMGPRPAPTLAQLRERLTAR